MGRKSSSSLLAIALGFLALIGGLAESAAQDAQRAKSGPSSQTGRSLDGPAAVTIPAVRGQLPPDSTTKHTIDLPGRQLTFAATAGSIPLLTDDGQLAAEIGYVSYKLEGAAPAKRPVTFAFNGGPGSSSAWVHAVGFGPWRLSTEPDALSPSAPAVLTPNPETWLDFTDLVFIDPVGTGFSRPARPSPTAAPLSRPPDQANPAAAQSPPGQRPPPREFYSVDGDADSVAEMIALWLRRHQRIQSPKVLVGESYGGIRGPKVLQRLQTRYGTGVGAMVLISPVMDFATHRGPRHRTQPFVNWLPSIAAAAREAKGQPFKSRNELAEVETYARGDFLADLSRGPRDRQALDRVVTRVAALSGLSEAVVRQYGGRLDEFIYIREANRSAQRQASGYDTSVTGDDADPTAYFPRWDDPFSVALAAPLTSAMLELYAKLGWKTDMAYQLSAQLRWQWGNLTNGVESISQLQSSMALDSKLRLLVTHGATDLRTPYFASALLLEQLPGYADRPKGRVELKVYPGGHMHYSRDGSRVALRDDVKALIGAIAPGS